MSGPLGPLSPIGPHLNPSNPRVVVDPSSPVGPPIHPRAAVAEICRQPQPLFEAAVALDIITEKWNDLGGARGPAVIPVLDGIQTGNRCYFQDFANGAIYRIGDQAFYLHGDTLRRYNELGASEGELGRPTSDVLTTPDGEGLTTGFDSGSIYFTQSTGAVPVSEPHLSYWRQRGAEKSYLGYPTRGRTNDIVNFQNGTVHTQGGAFVFDAADARVIETGQINVDGAAANARATLTLSATGSWEYKGVMRTSGVLSHDVLITTVFDFRTPDGKVFAFAEKGDVEGTFVFGGDREHRFHQFGMEEAIKENWQS